MQAAAAAKRKKAKRGCQRATLQKGKRQKRELVLRQQKMKGKTARSKAMEMKLVTKKVA